MTDQVPPLDEARLKAALRAALDRLVSASNEPAEVLLAQAEAEFSALLMGKDLKDPAAAQLARIIREVLTEARGRLYDEDHSTA